MRVVCVRGGELTLVSCLGAAVQHEALACLINLPGALLHLRAVPLSTSLLVRRSQVIPPFHSKLINYAHF